jgi:TPR repeat protein
MTTVGPPALAQDMTIRPWSAEQGQAALLSAARKGDLAAQVRLARELAQREPARSVEYWGAASASPASGALEALRAPAAAGNIRAAYFLGRGLVSRPDPASRTEGLRWLRAAAEAGDADAAFTLGCLLIGIDRTEGARWFSQVERATPKLAPLTRVLAARRHQRDADWRPVPGARTAYLQDFERSREHEQLSLAYWGVSSREVSDALAMQSDFGRTGRLAELALAAHVNDPTAIAALHTVLISECDDGRRRDRDACAAALLMDARLITGTNAGQIVQYPEPFRNDLDVGRMFELGVGGPVDLELATICYRRALRAVNDLSSPEVRVAGGEAAFRLFTLSGQGAAAMAIDNDFQEALRLGHPLAAYTQALYLIEQGQPTDALGSLRTAANGGISDAGFRYATILSGLPMLTERQRGDIYRYFRQAAEEGLLPAFDGVARAYWNGWGVPVDEAKAEEWWNLAARAGDARSALIVGIQHQKRGDHAGAIPWLRRAADGGVPSAAERLRQVQQAGYREQNLAGFLQALLESGGEVLQGMEDARQYQITQVNEQIRQSMLLGYVSSPDVDAEGNRIDQSPGVVTPHDPLDSGGSNGGPDAAGSGSAGSSYAGSSGSSGSESQADVGAGSTSGYVGGSGGQGGSGSNTSGLSGTGVSGGSGSGYTGSSGNQSRPSVTNQGGAGSSNTNGESGNRSSGQGGGNYSGGAIIVSSPPPPPPPPPPSPSPPPTPPAPPQVYEPQVFTPLSTPPLQGCIGPGGGSCRGAKVSPQ